METEILPRNIPKTSYLLSWILIALAMISCFSRPDYNIILGFLILFVRGHNSGDKRKLILRFELQILLISLIFDIFWFLKYNSDWCHGEETSELWQSLSFIHNCAFYLSILESILKIPIILFVYKDFTNVSGSPKELVNFEYQPSKN